MGARSLSLSDRLRLSHLVRSTRHADILISMIKKYGWTLGAEIGVLRGKTLFALLDAVPGLTMYGIDQWKRLPLRDDENAETYHDFDMNFLAKNVMDRACGYGHRCRILPGDSVLMSELIDDGELDFVFIDGDHTESGVTRDIEAWAPKIRPGGYLLGHDCHWTSVKRTIDRICPGWRDYGQAVWGIQCAP